MFDSWRVESPAKLKAWNMLRAHTTVRRQRAPMSTGDRWPQATVDALGPPVGDYGGDFGGLTAPQRAERVVDYDETCYGFVRLATEALRGAGVLPPKEKGEAVDVDADAAVALSDVGSGEYRGGRGEGKGAGRCGEDCSALLANLDGLCSREQSVELNAKRSNPFVAPLSNALRHSPAFQAALRAFVRDSVCPALGVTRVAYQRSPTFRVHLAGGRAGPNVAPAPHIIRRHLTRETRAQNPWPYLILLLLATLHGATYLKKRGFKTRVDGVARNCLSGFVGRAGTGGAAR
jgi:hypothetical protein